MPVVTSSVPVAISRRRVVAHFSGTYRCACGEQTTLGQKGLLLPKCVCTCAGGWRFYTDDNQNPENSIQVVIESPVVQAIVMLDYPEVGGKLNLQGGIVGLGKHKGLYEILKVGMQVLRGEEAPLILVRRVGDFDLKVPFYNVELV